MSELSIIITNYPWKSKDQEERFLELCSVELSVHAQMASGLSGLWIASTSGQGRWRELVIPQLAARVEKGLVSCSAPERHTPNDLRTPVYVIS